MDTPSTPEKTTLPHTPKLLDQVIAKIRFKHYSRRTYRPYTHWIKRSHLAVACKIAASTQNLATMLFHYRDVPPLNRRSRRLLDSVTCR